MLDLRDFENLWEWCRLFRKYSWSSSFVPSKSIMDRINVGPYITILNWQSWAKGFKSFFSLSLYLYLSISVSIYIYLSLNISLYISIYECLEMCSILNVGKGNRKKSTYLGKGNRQKSTHLFSVLSEMFPDINSLKETYPRLKTKSKHAVCFHIILLNVFLKYCRPSWFLSWLSWIQ